ncbi:MAG TPA: OmpA family protein [Clostridia bacterium]|nr:OmpA family protein [Clostridia bacterium]
MKKQFLFALPLAATLILPAAAQQNSDMQQQQPAAQSQPASDELGARQPLQQDTKQGFWGKLNPFARKKYVERQLSPVRNRVNELDELTANNSRMLRDVDSRATEGIRVATAKATEADQKALAAGQRAQEAHQTASQASTRLQTVEQVVGTLDQYSPANQTEIRFRSGQSTLSQNAKAALDELVANTRDQKGYIFQIQGFSPGRGQQAIQNSQSMAQAVARYLVIEHNVPVYRIFMVGMGNVPVQTSDGKAQRVRAGRVDVTLMKNGLDQLQTASAAPMQQGGVAGASQPGSVSDSGSQQQPAMGNQAAPWQQPSQSAPQTQPQQPSEQPR